MKKIILILLIALALTGCAKSNEEGTLVVGMECNSAPFNWTQLENTPGSIPLENGIGYCDGYDVVISQAIADDLDLKLVIKDHAVFSSLINSVKSGDIDLIVAGMTDTPERRQQIDFSNVYYRTDLVLVVQESSPFAGATKLSDFSGAHVAAQFATIHDEVLDQIPNVNHGVPLESYPLLTTALKSNAIDAFVAEKPIADAIAKSNPGLKVISFESGSGFEISDDEVTVSIGIKKGREDLLKDVNRVLDGFSDADRHRMMAEAIERQPN